jgi:hypothetical protein
MSAADPGPLSIDRSSVTLQVKRAHPLIDRNAIYPVIPPRGIGDGGGQWLPSWNMSRCGRHCHSEWLNAPHSKCGIGASLSGIRIPPSPPDAIELITVFVFFVLDPPDIAPGEAT